MNKGAAAGMILAMYAGMVPSHLQQPSRKPKRKVSMCRNNSCTNDTDHKCGFCSPECSRGES